jgi:hypothetical protein
MYKKNELLSKRVSDLQNIAKELGYNVETFRRPELIDVIYAHFHPELLTDNEEEPKQKKRGRPPRSIMDTAKNTITQSKRLNVSDESEEYLSDISDEDAESEDQIRHKRKRIRNGVAIASSNMSPNDLFAVPEEFIQNIANSGILLSDGISPKDFSPNAVSSFRQEDADEQAKQPLWSDIAEKSAEVEINDVPTAQSDIIFSKPADGERTK